MVESVDKLSYVEMAGVCIPRKSIKANSGTGTPGNPESTVENGSSSLERLMRCYMHPEQRFPRVCRRNFLNMK